MTDKERGLCPFCQKKGVLKDKEITVRRGDQSVTFPGQYWECSSGCLPEHEPTEKYPVFAWEDMEMLRQHSSDAKLAWLAKYGEEMPPGRKIRRRQKKS